MNDQTISYYDKNARKFYCDTINADMSACRDRFLKWVKHGKKILDAGCGSGRDVLAFLEEGYEVEAFDASMEMCRIASETTGIHVSCLRFEELTGQEQYDGIWACASLLHVKQEDLPDVLIRLCRLLKKEGVLYASFKYGEGERLKGGRYFYDLTEDTCRKLLKRAGLTMKEVFITCDVRSGRENDRWVNAIAQKARLL